MYQTILFDLDGTLTDSSSGIMNSICFALEKMSIPIPDGAVLRSFIGPPLQESFAKYFDLSAKDAQKAVSFYRQYFSETGLFENYLYPDVIKVLQELKSNGLHLILATSKPEVFAKQILKHFDIHHFFDIVAGASLDGQRSAKADVIRNALEKAEIKDTTTCLMVGDREHDIHGAQANQVESIGVLYGFGSQEELEQAGATHMIRQLTDLPHIVTNDKTD